MATTREAWNEEANPKERIGFLPTYSGGTHLPASAARVKVGLGQEAIVPDFAWCPGASAPSPASRQTRPVRLRTDDRRRVASAHRMAVKSVDYDGKDLADKPIDVQGGQSITGVTVVLTKGLPDLQGTLLDATGNPAPGTVLLFPDDPDKWIEESRLTRVARPDDTGIGISGLADWDWRLGLSKASVP